MPQSLNKVSLISVGPARGHVDKVTKKPIFVDPTTLDEIMVALSRLPSLKVREDHGSGVGETLGYVDNFIREENQIYGDLHFYDNAENVALLTEIAKKNPTHLGLSLEFSGEDEETPDIMLSRCSTEGVVAVALVSDPAANKSLFSALLNSTDKVTHKNMATPNQPKAGDSKSPATLPDISTLATRLDEMGKRFDSLPDVSNLTTQLSDLTAKYETLLSKFTVGEQPADQNPVTEEAKKLAAEEEAKKLAASGKTFSEDEAKKIAEFSAAATVKLFAAQFGNVFVLPSVKPVDTSVNADETPVKKFEAIVTKLATEEFKGDLGKARVAAMHRFTAEYSATRMIAPKK